MQWLSLCSQLSEAREVALEADMTSARRRVDELEARLVDARLLYEDEREDWTELRRDLQTAVVVAETIRSEAQDALDALAVENKALRDRNESLARQLEASNATTQSLLADGCGRDMAAAGSILARQHLKREYMVYIVIFIVF